MTPRFLLIAGALGALAACQPAVPDSGALPGSPGRGVGFDTSAAARSQATQAQLPAAAPVQSQALPTASAASSATPSRPATAPARDPLIARAETALGGTPAASQPRGPNPDDAENARATAANSGQEVVIASPSNQAPTIINNPGISDENSFDAVSSRESIASDKERIARNRAQYEVVQPTALPDRAGGGQPNVVAYALQTSHPKGTQIYRRLGFNTSAKFARNCAVYSSADEAQIDFLARGGPERDRQGLDPDGDGYACNWDPRPYRRAASN